jgi:hypothetical protein
VRVVLVRASEKRDAVEHDVGQEQRNGDVITREPADLSQRFVVRALEDDRVVVLVATERVPKFGLASGRRQRGP